MNIRWIVIFNFFFISTSGQSPAMRIDSLMRSYYGPEDPGAIVAVLQNKSVWFEKGYGVADLKTQRPITSGDNFNIGSLTKQFTAFGILTLQEHGALALADSMGKYFRLPASLAAVRVRDMLSHSSGLPDHYAFTDTVHVKHATDSDVLNAMQHASRLYFTSGTRYRYSNTAYCLLGLLIEKQSGLTYPDFLQKEIFEPLGIQHAVVFGVNRPISNRVIGYERGPGGNFVPADANESIFYSTEADGGIYISMHEYLKWCAAVAWGKFSDKPAIKQAWSGHTIVDTLRHLSYGYGWFIHAPAGRRKSIYHTGFNGGFRTVVFLIPDLGYGVSIFSNRGDIDLEELVRKINSILKIPDNSFIKSGPLESFIHSWPIFAPCKETRLSSILFRKNWSASGVELN